MSKRKIYKRKDNPQWNKFKKFNVQPIGILERRQKKKRGGGRGDQRNNKQEFPRAMVGHVEALLCVMYHVDPGATTDTVLPHGTESLGRERQKPSSYINWCKTATGIHVIKKLRKWGRTSKRGTSEVRYNQAGKGRRSIWGIGGGRRGVELTTWVFEGPRVARSQALETKQVSRETGNAFYSFWTPGPRSKAQVKSSATTWPSLVLGGTSSSTGRS